MGKYKRAIIDTVFLVGLIALTAYFMLDGRNLDKIIDVIQDANDNWLLLAVILVFVFICGESVIMRYLYRVLGTEVRLIRCIKYSFIGFFFSCVTPSATGGQPMQVYYMGRDKLSVSESCLVLLIITIGYKAALVVMSGFFFVFQNDIILDNLDYVAYILAYGAVVNILFILFLMMLIFNADLTTKTIRYVCGVLSKIHVLKDADATMEKIITMMQPYREGAVYLKKHMSVFFKVLLLSIAQRTALFLVTWCVYRSFGLHGISAIKIVALQTIISLSVDMLPLPGGVGASEKSFEIMFDRIFGAQFVIPGMILSRGISYYLLLIVTGVVTVIVHISSSLLRKTQAAGDE